MFYMNAIYYVITSLCLYNEINCITHIYFLQVHNEMAFKYFLSVFYLCIMQTQSLGK